VLLEGCDEGTGPITIGRQTEGGRVANGETEIEVDDVTEETTWVDDEGPHPDRGETTPGVEGVPPELDATEPSNPSTVAVEPI